MQEYAKDLPPDHPIRVYLEENEYLRDLLFQLHPLNPEVEYQLAYNLFNQIAQVDVRYTRKENQFFPFLEKRGWFGPSQGMWRFHDENRKLIREARKKIEARDFHGLKEDLDLLIGELLRMTEVEEFRLFPTALQILLPEDWEAMKLGEGEIGWMHKKTKEEPPAASTIADLKLPDGVFPFSEGRMTIEQVNMLLQAMPFDLTYVDETDRVVFYNRGAERVFPRSAGVIGREVRFCHPPKSVDTVLKILEEFRAGRRDVADFWINYRGRVVHIRYFAVRDAGKNYRGVIEVTQDVTEIQKLTGEKRLLDWS
ncbi:MAG: DUF438 domain-containing protein [Bdellovibrionales bacterium]|nr:DUF438 domain-containing protein [Bdellovibrionales bacterium]